MVFSGVRVTRFLILCVRFVLFYVVSLHFHNISVISWQSVLLVEGTGGPGENHRPVASHRQTLSHNVVHCMFCISLFVLFLLVIHCIVCLSIDRFGLPLWYLQTLLNKLSKHKIVEYNRVLYGIIKYTWKEMF